ncbi:MAG: YggT family protein [Candidatus Aminicenantes bacterium]|nr:YggT family protein [Candidatus Aminicenantes bacterium]NIM79665.1 YggT family protein [Candidatus Aminicenantes bacterium]NIN18991.1 YggT family protein [Candidatus Aminicenantes bacterium]NIN42893.1 YggT family protein [Candidatus Aminicenantes bacterium]NIN85630.1 YggT family protein [Candidatus Aminicenantes bacterium]
MGRFLNALVQVISVAIYVYSVIILIRAVISWMGNIPTNNLIILLRRITDPVFRFVHRHLPFTIIGGIDISPIIIVMVLYLINTVIISTLGDYARQLMMRG